jgi:hypothetical protein
MAWRLGGLEAWRLGGLEAWRFGGLEAWRLGSLGCLWPTAGERADAIELATRNPLSQLAFSKRTDMLGRTRSEEITQRSMGGGRKPLCGGMDHLPPVNDPRNPFNFRRENERR